MPSTCMKTSHAGRQGGARPEGPASKRQKACTHAKLDLRQLIPRIMLPENEGALRKCCAESLERICGEYEINPLIRVFTTLREFSEDREEPQSSILALFFLVLDVDVRLNQMMLEAESTPMQRKLAGFFVRLRSELIPAFLCEEPVEVENFVRTCHEAYVLA